MCPLNEAAQGLFLFGPRAPGLSAFWPCPHFIGSVGSCDGPPSRSGHSGSGKTEAAKQMVRFLSGLEQEQTRDGGCQVGAAGHFPGPPFSFGPGGGLGVPGFSSGTAQSPGTECPQLGGLTGGSRLFWGDLNTLPPQLDDVLPWLGSFGHATTVLNANASRFGQVLCLRLQQ